MTARTQKEILARFREVHEDPSDPFAWRLEVLTEAMTADTIRVAVPDVHDEDLADWTPVDTEPTARAYLTFAVVKIRGHRGISASRSVDKLREYAWLLGRDDVTAAMDAVDYPQYGAPKVKVFADGLGWEWPDEPQLARMAAGEPCTPDCERGCGL